MELVASSYDSDVEEVLDIEENKKSRVQSAQNSVPKSIKNFDVIDIESDTDDETTTQSENTLGASSDNTPASNKPDCIDISEEGHISKRVSLNSHKIPNIIPEAVKKKNDFLNLNGSDNDEEIPPVIDKMDVLKSNASLLNDVPCGPVKPTEPSSNFQNSVNNISTDRNTPCSSDINVDNRENIDNKRLKLDTEVPQPVTDLFKEDARVIQASQKNIVCRMPKQIAQTHTAHSNVIMALNWCIPQYSHLYLTVSLDGFLKIWDLYHRNPVQIVNVGTGLRAAKWSLDGGQIVTGGIGKKSWVFDVQTGKRIIEYDIYNFVNSVEVHPYMEDVFLVGTTNAILGFDIRVNTKFPIRSFFSNCKEVLDIVFLDENEFVCSTNVVSHDSADRTIMVWDFSSGAVLSNQIFLERYTCPSLKVHPSDSSFVAQTNGDYIACFSTTRPYKIKNKKYAGHTVSGYSIECDISPDGKYLVSGDAEGNVFFYNYANTVVVHKTCIKQNKPTNCIKWHPAFPSMMISASYDGQVQIWK